MDERVAKLRTYKDAEILARNADRRGHSEIAEEARARAVELKAAEKEARRAALPPKQPPRRSTATTNGRVAGEALFINGVFELVLDEILQAQASSPDLVCYLQPYKPALIKRLKEDPPSSERPWKIFISLTRSLGLVSFEADVVEWRDKSTLASGEITELNVHFAMHQPRERCVHFEAEDGEYGRNILGIVGLRRIDPAIVVSGFTKVSDDLPLRDRTRAGGWSYVVPPESREAFEVVAEASLRESEAKELSKAVGRSAQKRRERLEAADPVPQQIFVVTKAFLRNQDVVAEVLERANGHCQDCHSPAPFLRARDGTPFLEVHHVVTLAQGGLDTVENSIALCPNCHRKRHYGALADPTE